VARRQVQAHLHDRAEVRQVNQVGVVAEKPATAGDQVGDRGRLGQFAVVPLDFRPEPFGQLLVQGGDEAADAIRADVRGQALVETAEHGDSAADTLAVEHQVEAAGRVHTVMEGDLHERI